MLRSAFIPALSCFPFLWLFTTWLQSDRWVFLKSLVLFLQEQHFFLQFRTTWQNWSKLFWYHSLKMGEGTDNLGENSIKLHLIWCTSLGRSRSWSGTSITAQISCEWSFLVRLSDPIQEVPRLCQSRTDRESNTSTVISNYLLEFWPAVLCSV